MEIVAVSGPLLLVPSDVSAIALDFKVLHPVVITKLGVFSTGTRPELHSNVTVKLLQLDQEVMQHKTLDVLFFLWSLIETELEGSWRAVLVAHSCFTLVCFRFFKNCRVLFFCLSVGGCDYSPLQLHQHGDHGKLGLVQTSGTVHLAQG